MQACPPHPRVTVAGALATLALALAGPSRATEVSSALPEGIPPLPPAYTQWPRIQSPVPLDPAQESRIAAIVAGMTLEQKVGQMTQADALHITPDEVRRYFIGSVMVEGNGWPANDRHAPASAWLALADRLWDDLKIRIDRRKLGVGTIKRVGRYAVPVEVFGDVTAELRLLVVPEGGELPPEQDLEAAAAAEAASAEEAAHAHAEAEALVRAEIAAEEQEAEPMPAAVEDESPA